MVPHGAISGTRNHLNPSWLQVEEAKRKQIARYLDLQDALNAANNKISSLEKAKSRLLQETEDARSDVDRYRIL